MTTQVELDGLIAHSEAVTAGLKKMGAVPPPDTGAAKLILKETFEGGTARALKEQIDLRHYFPGTQVRPFEQINGKFHANYYAAKGTNERSPIMFYADAALVRQLTGADTFHELYIAWEEYYPTAYPFASSGQKILRIGYDDAEHPESKKDFTFATLNNNVNVQASWYMGAWGDKTFGVVDSFINSNKPHPVTMWVIWRLWVKLNTPGLSDGFVRVFQNGLPFASSESQNMRGKDIRGYNFFWYGGNYSNLQGEVLKSSGIRRMGGLTWWNTQP